MKKSSIAYIVIIIIVAGGLAWHFSMQNPSQTQAPSNNAGHTEETPSSTPPAQQESNSISSMPMQDMTAPANTSSGSAQTSAQTGTQTAAPAATSAPSSSAGEKSMSVSVSIANFAYDPATITVKTGATVTWKNNDIAPHTVTSDTGDFGSQTLQPGESYSHTFTATGTFAYHCTIHPYMHGTVVVQ